MSKTQVYNQTGEKVAELDLNPKVFGLEEIDASLVHHAVRIQRNSARLGLAHTKNRGEVRGGGKKPWKQKGTGNARAGSTRSPLWRHGGVTFGPRSDRNFSLKINRSAFRKALFTVLTDKVNEKKLAVIDSFESVSKTAEANKRLNEIAGKAGLGKKLLLIIDKPDRNLAKSFNNLPSAHIAVANKLNVLDLLNHDLIITKDAVKLIEDTYLKTKST